MPTQVDETRWTLALKGAIHEQNRYQFEMDTKLMLPYTVDEVSILFATRGELQRFTAWAAIQGMMHFNTVFMDEMVRQDQIQGPVEKFNVQFEFLRFPDHKWRIEAMACWPKGSAVLHKRLLERSKGAPTIAHASFKTHDRQEYTEAQGLLTKAGLGLQAAYRNSYGLFSYWSGIRSVYLKPRVNLRDGQSVL